MCNCHNIEMGSYDACVTVQPFWRKKMAGVDRCILPEVLALWKMGHRTLESCCGHNVSGVPGYIAVTDGQIEAMRAMGYKPDPRGSRGCFLARTV